MAFPRRAAVVIASCLLACSLGGLSGFSSGGPPDAGGDDAPRTEEGGSVDAPTETEDGSSPQFFDDFERDNVLGPWQTANEEGGAIALDTTTSHSPSRSLRSTVSEGRGRRAWLGLDFLGAISRARMTFWMKVPATTRVTHLARLRLELPGETGGQLLLETGAEGKVYLGEQHYDGPIFTGHVVYDLPGFVPDVWQSWTFEIDASTTPSKARVTIDGVVAHEQALTVAFPKGALRTAIGISYTDEGPELSVHYDDVQIVYEP